ncbi:MbtH family protein [Sphaerisporangium sp. B11E5]|uniref:MbtH family protein n=1 Tax=Sphaerisporangium sp. B11E5 TaxID=3153563 RepID=UPI00325E272E
MANPFEDPSLDYLVLINDEGQHSLWPEFAQVPPGWRVAFSGNREQCLAHVESSWTDMRPNSLIRAMDERQQA